MNMSISLKEETGLETTKSSLSVWQFYFINIKNIWIKKIPEQWEYLLSLSSGRPLFNWKKYNDLDKEILAFIQSF